MRKHFIYLLGLSVILSYLIVSFSRDFQNWMRVSKNVDTLEEKSRELGVKRLDLERKLDYTHTNDYLEGEARERLNMGREGETVLLMPSQVPSVVQDKE